MLSLRRHSRVGTTAVAAIYDPRIPLTPYPSSSSAALNRRHPAPPAKVIIEVAGLDSGEGQAAVHGGSQADEEIPALAEGNSTCGLVAGARYEPLQIDMKPMERFLAGLRRAA